MSENHPHMSMVGGPGPDIIEAYTKPLHFRQIGVALQIPNCPQKLEMANFDLNESIPTFIEHRIKNWNLPNRDPSHYSLQWDKEQSKNLTTDYVFLTSENISLLKSGDFLKLTESIDILIDTILSSLRANNISGALSKLAPLCADPLFAPQFAVNGYEQIARLLKLPLEVGKDDEIRAKILQVYQDLTSFETSLPDILSDSAIQDSFFRDLTMYTPYLTIPAVQEIITRALAIIEHLIQADSAIAIKTTEMVPPETLCMYLSRESSSAMKSGSLSLMISIIEFLPSTERNFYLEALFKPSSTKSRPLSSSHDSSSKSRHFRCRRMLYDISVEASVTGRSSSSGQICPKLSTLQHAFLSMAAQKVNIRISNSSNLKSGLDQMMSIAFPNPTAAAAASTAATTIGAKSPSFSLEQSAENFYRLGFKDTTNPINDFMEASTKYGTLPYEFLFYFAGEKQQKFQKMVSDNTFARNDQYQCPIVQSGLFLTGLLLDIFQVNDTVIEHQTSTVNFYPLLFQKDTFSPLHEIFAVAIELFGRTWKEMKATRDDFDKVCNVVSEQLRRSFSSKAARISFENLDEELKAHNYTAISRAWEQERERREQSELNAKPIQELRSKLAPEIIQLVQKQRMNFMMRGTIFTMPGKSRDKTAKTTKGDKGPCGFLQLASNRKAFLCVDCKATDETKPSMEGAGKLMIDETMTLRTGLDCPHVREKDKKDRIKAGDLQQMPLLYFTISKIEDDGNQVDWNFVSNYHKEYKDCQWDFDHWVDGINYLLGMQMSSEQYNKDLKMLLDMELKVRLLDLEGLPDSVKIPNEAPPVPPLPENLDPSTW